MKTTMTFVVSLNIEKLRTGVTIVRNVISYVQDTHKKDEEEEGRKKGKSFVCIQARKQTICEMKANLPAKERNEIASGNTCEKMSMW